MNRTAKSPRIFYAPEARDCRDASPDAPRPLGLPPEEAYHAGQVLRLRTGDAVRLFDGEGWFYDAEIAAIDRRRTAVIITSAETSAAEPHTPVVLLVALLKGRKDDLLVQKCVELGVTAIVFFPAERSVVRLDAAAVKKETERWGRVVVAACQQCRRAGLMRVALAPDLQAALESVPDEMNRIVFWEELAGAPKATENAALAATSDGACALIGPEGGFTGDEIAQVATAGFRTASLGPRILRAETAVLAAATILLRNAGELG